MKTSLIKVFKGSLLILCVSSVFVLLVISHILNTDIINESEAATNPINLCASVSKTPKTDDVGEQLWQSFSSKYNKKAVKLNDKANANYATIMGYGNTASYCAQVKQSKTLKYEFKKPWRNRDGCNPGFAFKGMIIFLEKNDYNILKNNANMNKLDFPGGLESYWPINAIEIAVHQTFYTITLEKPDCAYYTDDSLIYHN
jgi:hypothetical protein